MRVTPIALVCVLAACTTADHAPADTVAAAIPDTAAAAASQFITAHGFGPLALGMTTADAGKVTNGALTVPSPSAPDQCEYAKWETAPNGVMVMFVGGVLKRVDVMQPGTPTVEGLEVGQTAARADSLYGAKATRQPHKYEAGEYLIVKPLAPQDSLQRLVVELTGGKVARFRIGLFPEVEWVEGCA
ncbi:MAG TPA: hypothetical protein VGE27_02020 [Gemmatimonas sp.]|uniref:hypothetical protein n=1 Tax=Gemmatimonas sp. TaxID=1962908 RepID=UPI002EDB1ECD